MKRCWQILALGLGLTLGNSAFAAEQSVEQVLHDFVQARAIESQYGYQRVQPSSITGLVLQMLNDHWATDPQVLAYFRKLLVDQDIAVLDDLDLAPNIWADDYVELLARMVQKPGPNPNPIALHLSLQDYREAMEQRLDGSKALALLDRHYSIWAKDTKLAASLRNAYFGGEPHLEQYVLQSAKPNDNNPADDGWIAAVQKLALTHDPAAVAWLRPYLDDKTLVHAPGMTQEMTVPVRACDLAHDAILHILNEPGEFGILFDFIMNDLPAPKLTATDLQKIRAQMLSAQPGPNSPTANDPKDDQIAALAKQLDAKR